MRHPSHRFAALFLVLVGCGGRFADDDAGSDPDASPPTAPSVHPFRPGQDWVGTYTCAQGLTDLDLRIVATDGDTISDALFLFDWKTGGESGSYHMTGTFDPKSGNATFTPKAWIDQPDPSWHMVGMSGAVVGHRYAGDITDSECGTFGVTR